jgi:hypothetical protein
MITHASIILHLIRKEYHVTHDRRSLCSLGYGEFTPASRLLVSQRSRERTMIRTMIRSCRFSNFQVIAPSITEYAQVCSLHRDCQLSLDNCWNFWWYGGRNIIDPGVNAHNNSQIAHIVRKGCKESCKDITDHGHINLSHCSYFISMLRNLPNRLAANPYCCWAK